MRITILCSSQGHPVYPRLQEWRANHLGAHDISLLTDIGEVSQGDILFLISFTQIVKGEVRDRFKHTLVVHASDLPRGRGWSPHIWHILNGENKIHVTLLEAEDKVDSGDIWAQRSLELEGHELFDEINKELFDITIELLDFAVQNSSSIVPTAQSSEEATYFPRRTPRDSELDPNKTIAEQFDMMRVCDPNRFPCFFNFRGHEYKIKLEKC